MKMMNIRLQTHFDNHPPPQLLFQLIINQYL